jgi:GntR family transcriptional repressor for pyruvate dehydrogenase complex
VQVAVKNMKRYPIERKTLSEQVAERLELEIREGVYQTGDQLPPERKLMEQFGVGRPAIREALFYLQKLGFVAIRNGTRPRVIKPTVDSAIPRISTALRATIDDPQGQRDLQNARVLFEVAVCREVAQRATAQDVQKLREALEANGRTVGNEPEFKRSDNAFHAALAEATQNPLVSAVHDALATLLDDRRAQALQQPGEDKVAYRFHNEIFAAIANGDADEAEDAMRRHLDHHYGTFRTIKQNGPQPTSTDSRHEPMSKEGRSG